MVKTSIVGGGFVGTRIASGLRKLGHEVIICDIDEERVRVLTKEGFKATTYLPPAVQNSEVSFLTVQTPTLKGKIDLRFIRKAVESVGKSLKQKPGYHLLVVKSTVVPLTTEKVIIPALEKYSGKKAGKGFGVCVNPEFLTEIHRSWTKKEEHAKDFFTEDRIVIGELDKKSGNLLEKIYEPLNIPIFRTDLRTAEMIKYASNCALATRISYWNEIFYICEKVGVDSQVVARISGLDKRIGEYGTVHGKAFGGKCLPKDLDAFISFSKQVSHEPKLLMAVAEINKRIAKERGVRE